MAAVKVWEQLSCPSIRGGIKLCGPDICQPTIHSETLSQSNVEWSWRDDSEAETLAALAEDPG